MNKKGLTSVIPLPSDFPDRVLKLEISVEVESSMESLKSLLELYSQAIEFYESIRDPKYRYYQDRMTAVLQRQSTLLLRPESSPPDLKQQRQADLTIKIHENNSKQLSRQVSMNLEKQNSMMMDRFKNRKSRNTSVQSKDVNKKKMRFSMAAHKRTSSEGESDKSGGLKLEKQAERFEVELEKIMEESVMEKIIRSKEIKKRYHEAMNDVGKDSTPLMAQLLKELEKNMQTELSALEKELENRRKVAIQNLKQSLLPLKP